MKMAIITKPHAFGHCRVILQRHLKVIKEVSSPGFMCLIKGLPYLNFVQKAVSHIHDLSYMLRLWSWGVKKDGLQMSWNSASMPAQQGDVFWCSDSCLTDNMLLTVNHAPRPFELVTCLLMGMPAWCLPALKLHSRHSNFIPDSW
jgi:hypothetical protein